MRQTVSVALKGIKKCINKNVETNLGKHCFTHFGCTIHENCQTYLNILKNSIIYLNRSSEFKFTRNGTYMSTGKPGNFKRYHHVSVANR